MKRKSVLIADEQALIGATLKAILEQDYRFVGRACDGCKTVELALPLKPDVIMASIDSSLLNAIEVTVQIKRVLPNTHIVLFGEMVSPYRIANALRAGISAYVSKSKRLPILKESLEQETSLWS